jgi:hypothetical protein
VTDWGVVFLGLIALATLTTAIVQVGVLVAAGRVARRVEMLADRVERDVKPLLVHLDAIGRDASKATSLAAAQVERADRVFADLADRLDRTLNTIHSAAAGGAREGAAMLAAFRAALAVVRDIRAGRARSRADDEDALFI